MSIDFYGKAADGRRIVLSIEHPAAINMANGNARAFLEFLGLPGTPEGEITMPEARRALVYALSTMERRVKQFTREPSDTKRPGRPRLLDCGITEEYFARRLIDFDRFLNAVAERGATAIYWG